jgi:hypothetical protein
MRREREGGEGNVPQDAVTAKDEAYGEANPPSHKGAHSTQNKKNRSSCESQARDDISPTYFTVYARGSVRKRKCDGRQSEHKCAIVTLRTHFSAR